MLFDLQSRRRRTAVKIIYGFLAVLMAGGLVLLGVGVGNGNGGLLNAFSNNGSGGNSAQNSAVTQQLRAAEKKVKQNPNSAAAWDQLMEARWEDANATGNYNSTTDVYSAAGKAQLKQALAAWTKYQSLVKGAPDEQAALMAARAYAATGDYTGATVAWQAYIKAAPTASNGYTCLALTAYAAKNTTLGDEAAAKAVALAPKLDRLQEKQTFKTLKSSAADAKSEAQSTC